MTEQSTITVSVVEDNDALREGWGVLLKGSPGFTCIGAYSSAEEALEKIPSNIPDVILMDINLPGISGVDCVKKLKKNLPAISIIMITVHEDSEQVFEALKAGANGYLVKRTPPAKILEAIDDVLKGGSPMSSQIARLVVQSFQNPPAINDETAALTTREQEILALLAKGFRYKEIGESLFISTETVRGHLRHIYEKLSVRSRTEAVLKYLGK
ncbi:MAG: response regulator transcription factor [Ignavibacteriales bacterium]|nr:response regulator transcription factor [Ignavibacteriales bacterium]